jgi:hypothetical protein
MSINITWSTLDINRFATLKKECDDALTILNEADEAQKGILSLSLQEMIDELESFCIKYGDDERIVLFYKQKFRLRMAAQHIAVMGLSVTRPLSLSQPSSPRDNNTSIRDRSTSPQRTGILDNNNDTNTSRFVDYNTNASIRLNTTASDNLLKKSQKPIYAWELDDITPIRQRIRLEGAQFYPSSTPGVYMREDPLPREVVQEDKFIDIQVVLSEEEFTTLVSR